MELPKQEILLSKCYALSKNIQDTNHYIRHGILAGNLLLISITMLYLATCSA